MEELSEKAKNFIVINPLVKEAGCIIANDVSTHYSRDENMIYLNASHIKNGKFDFLYLHEYYHAIQADKGYPRILLKDRHEHKIEKNLLHIAGELNSAIADIDANLILKKDGFFYSSEEINLNIVKINNYLFDYVNNQYADEILRNLTYTMSIIIYIYFDVSTVEAKKFIKILESAGKRELVIRINRMINLIEKENIETIEGYTLIIEELVNIANGFCQTDYFIVSKKYN